jgi:exodeoxyribonuclease VII small subunit
MMRTNEVAGEDGGPFSGAEPQAQVPFEDALQELAEIVELLESGNVPLEQSIAVAQRGLALAEYCDTVVSEAEATLEQLVANSDGELVAQRMSYGDEDDVEEDVIESEHE